jgi:glucose-6-phosphate dehydrogenase assembly protein OpcA
MPVSAAPDRILKELADLWVSVAKEGDAGVLRACTMTLVTLTEEHDDAAGLGETIAALMPEHPSRAVVVRFHVDPRREVSARVSAHCWMPFGQRRQICSEQVEIAAGGQRAAELASLLLPIVAPDLPVILWCRSPRLLDLPDFDALAAIGHKLILDSGAMPDPPAALARMAKRVSAGRLVGDLSWTRLTRTRELVARIFENRDRLSRLSASPELRVTATVAPVPSWAWYLAAWVADGLRAAGAAPRVSAAPGPGDGLELRGGLDLKVMRDGDSAVVQVDSLTSRTLLPRPTDYLLLREELGIVARDPVFEKTLASAARLAVSSYRL